MAHSQKHILVAIVENKTGVLNRVSNLLRRRNFNIESIAVGHATQPNMSRMTMIVEGNNAKVEQVRKQLDKLIEVVKILDITEENPVSRELALIKIKATPATRSEIIEIVDIFRKSEEVGPIVDEAIKIGAKVVWMQEGVINKQAAIKTRNAGLLVIMNRCMFKEHRRLFPEQKNNSVS